MKLCPKEFEAMQSDWRKWYIREIELRTFKAFGLWIKDRDILEVGCGSGYAASLITAARHRPRKEAAGGPLCRGQRGRSLRLPRRELRRGAGLLHPAPCGGLAELL